MRKILVLVLLVGVFLGVSVLLNRPKSKIRNTAVLTNSIGMTFVEVPAGKFGMGYRRVTDELKGLIGYDDLLFTPAGAHFEQITLEFPFWLSRYETTHKQFKMFVEETGYLTDNERAGRKRNWRETALPTLDNHPVTEVSINDAVAFCQWLSQKEGKHYRLPTEAEWEYACRAGNSALFSFGNDVTLLPKFDNIADQALEKMPEAKRLLGFHEPISQWDDGYAYLAPVGSFLPNKFDLYDMHGNSSELCSDFFQIRDRDGLGKLYEDCCVVRGGAWCSLEAHATSFYRSDVPRDFGSWISGFRIVQERPMNNPDLED